ncbi:MAG: RNA polymerase sigma factor [Planctomycetota bacterium]|nr:RNA polymerase sigma factor [Planctomycetota bacterium]
MEQESGFEQLFEEREWVRALAERLCADAASAEDLAQDTWLEALREGGKARGARGWLGGVLRNLVARRRTRDAARSERERATARPEAVPGPDELLARAELQRRVLSAVANLPESYRSVVLLRHYEGLSAEDIARRSGESGSTVRNRLARAHSLLRERLDRDYGDRSLWSTLVVPATSTASKPLIAGGALVGWKLAASAAALMLIGAILWMRTDEPEAFSDSLVGVAVPVASAEVAQARVEDERVEAPTEVRAMKDVADAGTGLPSVADVASLMTWGTVVFGHVRPENDGEELESAPFVWLKDMDGKRTQVACASDGAFTLPSVAVGVHWLWASAGEQGTGTTEFEVVPGLQRLEVVVRLERPWKIDVIAGPGSDELRSGSSAFAVATIEPLGERFEENAAQRAGVFGFGIFRPGRSSEADPDSLGSLEIGVNVPVWVHLVRRRTVLDRKRVQPGATTVEFDLAGRDLSFTPGSVRARLVAADTRLPFVRGSVSLVGEFSKLSLGPIDADGRVKFSGLDPGPWRVSLFEAGYAWDEELKIEPGAELDLGDVFVSKGIALRGRVVGAEPGQLTVRVACQRLDQRTGEPVWSGGIRAFEIDAEGRFVAAGLIPGKYRLSFSGAGLPLVQRTVDVKDVPIENVELELAPGADLCVIFARDAEPADWLDVLSVAGERLGHTRLVPGSPHAFRVVSGTYVVRVGEHERRVTVGSEPLLVRMP